MSIRFHPGGTSIPVQDDAPSSPKEGDLWVDTSGDIPVLKVLGIGDDGVDWLLVGTTILVQDDAPRFPVEGDLWVDTTGSDTILKIYDGSDWAAAGGSGGSGGTAIPAQDDAPDSPSEGDLWVDTTGSDTVLKIYDGSDWTAVDTTGGGGSIMAEARGQTVQLSAEVNVTTANALKGSGLTMPTLADTDVFVISFGTPTDDQSHPVPWVVDGKTWNALGALSEGNSIATASVNEQVIRTRGFVEGSGFIHMFVGKASDDEILFGTDNVQEDAAPLTVTVLGGGLVVAGTAPASPSTGDLWIDTSDTDAVLRYHDGSGWVGVGSAAASGQSSGGSGNIPAGLQPPPNPELNDLWVDTYGVSDGASPILKLWATGAWLTVGRMVTTVQDTAPSSPLEGDLWVDTTGEDTILKLYDGSEWDTVGSSAAATTIPAQDTAPSSPSEGDLWVDTTGTTTLLKIYNGSAWVAVDTGTTITVGAAPSGAVENDLWLDTSGGASVLRRRESGGSWQRVGRRDIPLSWLASGNTLADNDFLFRDTQDRIVGRSAGEALFTNDALGTWPAWKLARRLPTNRWDPFEGAGWQGRISLGAGYGVANIEKVEITTDANGDFMLSWDDQNHAQTGWLRRMRGAVIAPIGRFEYSAHIFAWNDSDFGTTPATAAPLPAGIGNARTMFGHVAGIPVDSEGDRAAVTMNVFVMMYGLLLDSWDASALFPTWTAGARTSSSISFTTTSNATRYRYRKAQFSADVSFPGEWSLWNSMVSGTGLTLISLEANTEYHIQFAPDLHSPGRYATLRTTA